MGLLSLIPIRDYLWGGLVVVLSIFIGVEWHRHNVHEQQLGQQVVLAQDALKAAQVQKKVAAGTAAATTTETSNAKTYEAKVAAPVQPAPSIVCKRTASPPAGSIVPEAGAGVAPGTDQHPTVGGDGPAFDPTGPLLERAKLADAQIAYLQGRILELEKQMKDSP
jgi:hypothetical protein